MFAKGTSWPDGYGRTILPSVDSTMKEAARVAASSSFPQWICALDQTGAHGRRGRPWAMLQGNFAGTLVLYPDEPPQVVALRSFVAALALHDAFISATGRPDGFALKWPNDVLLNGGKVAGILLETTGGALCIGFGVNLADAPSPTLVEQGAVVPVSLAGETGALLTPEEFLDLLAIAYADWEYRFTTYGFEPIRSAWLARAARVGQPVRARTMTQEFHGTFETVDEEGNLVLKTSQGIRAIPAAEVFF